jgi:ubiquinone/menaquinone biosynthesis C-methylase UbiE
MGKADSTLPQWRIRVQKYVVDRVLVRESTKVLDCGCGVGYGVVFAAVPSRNMIVGVDISKMALRNALARARHMKAQSAAHFIRCNLPTLPIRSDSFDAVLCVLLIDAFQDLEPLLKEISCVLREGGKIIIADLDPTAFSMLTIGKIVQFLDKRSGHPYELHKSSDLEKILKEHSFIHVTKRRKHFGLRSMYIVEAEKTRQPS